MDAPFTGSVFLGMSVDGFIARLDGDPVLPRRRREAGRRPAPAPDDGDRRRLRLRGLRRLDRRDRHGPEHLRVHPALRRLAVPGQAGARAEHDPRAGCRRRITVHRSLDEAVAALNAAGYRRVYVDGGRTVHASCGPG